MSEHDEPDNFGFNKTARNAAKNADKSQAGGVVVLNPPFPYRSIPFQPEIFGARPSYLIEPETEPTN